MNRDKRFLHVNNEGQLFGTGNHFSPPFTCGEFMFFKLFYNKETGSTSTRQLANGFPRNNEAGSGPRSSTCQRYQPPTLAKKHGTGPIKSV